MDATVEEMEADFWADFYFKNPKKLEEFEDEDFDLDAELAKLDEEGDQAWDTLSETK